MSVTLPKLMARLGLDTSEFDRGLDEAAKKSKSSGSRIANGFAQIGGAAVLGSLAAVSAAVGATVTFIGTTIGPASDLNETINKTSVVFGNATDQVMTFAATASTSLGMTRNEALAGAATFGNLFRAMQMNETTSADMSTNLVQLAADLASFNNLDPTEVLDKLRSGLTGEFMPLKTLGVNINETTLKAKAMALGLSDGTGELSAAAKAQAAYALILEQTTLAQGDFARTSTGLANEQRILKATFGDLKASIGSVFLPLAEKGVGYLIQKLQPLLGAFQYLAQVVEWNDGSFSSLFTVFEDGSSYLGGFLEKLGMTEDDANKLAGTIIRVSKNIWGALTWVFTALKNVFGWLSDHKGVLIGIIVAIGVAVVVWAYQMAMALWAAAVAELAVVWPLLLIAAVVALLYEAWTKDWGGMRTSLTAFWNNTLKPFVMAIVNWFKVAIPAAIQFVKNVIAGLVTAWNWVVQAIQNVGAWFATLWQGIVTVVTAIGTFIYNVFIAPFVAVGTFLFNIFAPLFVAIFNLIQAAVSLVVTIIAGIWQNVFQPALQKVTGFMTGKVVPIFQAVGNAIHSAVQWVVNLIVSYWTTYWNVLKAIGEFIYSVFQPVFEALGNFFKNTLIPALTWLADTFNTIVIGALKDTYDWIKNKVLLAFQWLANKIATVTDALNTFTQKLKDAKDKLPDWMTPGSPTPLEIGLWGISDAFNRLNHVDLPSFSANLNLQPVGLPSVTGLTESNTNTVSENDEETKKLLRRMIKQLQTMNLTLPTSMADAVARK